MTKKTKITFFITFLLNMNCLIHKTSLLDQNFTFNEGNNNRRCLLLNKVSIIESDGEMKDILESLMRSNIKILLENSKSFQEVIYYSNVSISKDCYLIDIDFFEYENELTVHPNYFPLSIVTLTFYIWFGGPIVTYESKIKMNISVSNSENIKIKSESFEVNYNINDNIYNGWFSRREVPRLKSKFILESILKTIPQ
jgi:hypothetical protein